MFDSISAVSPRAVLRTSACLFRVMPLMLGPAVGMIACTERSAHEQSGNDPAIIAVSYTTVDEGAATVPDGAPTVRKEASPRAPTFDEELAALMRYGSNGP